MTKTFLTAVSAIALLAAMPMIAAKANAQANTSTNVQTNAEDERTANQNDIPEVTEQDMEEGWENTKEAVSGAADTVGEKTKNAYNNVRDAVTNDDDNSQNFAVNKVQVDSLTTANAIIGQPIYNGDERVGTVKDIILDNSGNPAMVIVADGDFFGMGKLAAFQYDSIVNVNNQGKVIMPLTERALDQAAEFSYDSSNYNNNVRMIPENGYSVANLLDGELAGSKGETLAQIDDIQFSNGATNLIVSYDQVLGLGGEKAALNFNAANVIKDGNDYNFQLNAQKTAQFESYKESATN